MQTVWVNKLKLFSSLPHLPLPRCPHFSHSNLLMEKKGVQRCLVVGFSEYFLSPSSYSVGEKKKKLNTKQTLRRKIHKLGQEDEDVIRKVGDRQQQHPHPHRNPKPQTKIFNNTQRTDSTSTSTPGKTRRVQRVPISSANVNRERKKK